MNYLPLSVYFFMRYVNTRQNDQRIPTNRLVSLCYELRSRNSNSFSSSDRIKMSEHRNRVISSTRLSMKEKQALGKENICITKQSNKLAGTGFQKIVPRKRSFSADLGCGVSCNCAANKDVVSSEIKSLAKKTPFRIHFDHAGNDLSKGARFRERIIEYDMRRVEKFKRNSQDVQTEVERTGKGSLVKKQQSDAKSVQDDLQNFDGNKAISRNSVVSGSKSFIKSIRIIPKTDLPRVTISTAKSLVDLSQANKLSTLTSRASDTVKLNLAKLMPVERNPVKKRSLSSSSTNRSSSANRLSTIPTRNRVVSIGSMNEVLNNVQKKQIKSDKYEKLGGSKDSLVSGPSAVLSCNSSKRQLAKAVVDYQIQENTKACSSPSHKFTPTGKKQKSDNQEEQLLVDVIPEKVQTQVESDLKVIQQNTDFSAYLLYHTDYFVDLLTVEKEKEDSSQKLSAEFIDKYINNESRKIVVAFLIRLSTHCRYPSYLLYQAIKIFDVTIDRIPLEGPSLQLTAVTALWIVLKKDGNFNKIPSVAKSMLEIAQVLPYENGNELVECERQILRILDFNITFSDPFSIFVFYVVNYGYVSHVTSDIITKIYYCGGYVIDLTLLDAKFSYTTSNHLGLTAAELVMSIVLDDEANLSSPRWYYWRCALTNGIHIPIRYYDEEINLLRATMITHILESAKKHTKEKAVRKRYNHNRYGNISEFFINKIMKLPQAEYSICM